jgi:hypothetical protein
MLVPNTEHHCKPEEEVADELPLTQQLLPHPWRMIRKTAIIKSNLCRNDIAIHSASRQIVNRCSQLVHQIIF